MQTECRRSYRRNIVLCVLASSAGYVDSLCSSPSVANPAIQMDLLNPAYIFPKSAWRRHHIDGLSNALL
jgi:hypothetical protein